MQLQGEDATRAEATRVHAGSLPPDPARKFQYGLASFPRGYLHEEIKVNKQLSDLFADTSRSRFPPASRHQKRFDTLKTEGREQCMAASALGSKVFLREYNGGGDVISWTGGKELPTHVEKQTGFKKWAGVNSRMVAYGAKIF